MKKFIVELIAFFFVTMLINYCHAATEWRGNWECGEELCRMWVPHGWVVKKSHYPTTSPFYYPDEHHEWKL